MRQHTEKLKSEPGLRPLARAASLRTRTLQRGAIISAPQSSAFRGPAWLAVKAVGSFVPKLTQKSFEKYGFSTATLLTDWARIVGVDLARDTSPERLKWPRGAAGQSTGESYEAGGATLVIRVDPARALDISYKERQIIERINSYFGYRAISDLRMIQAPVTLVPVAQAAVAASASPTPRQALHVPLEPGKATTAIEDSTPLSQALAQLEARVMGRSQT